ncbi:MAG: hypothetical protein Q9159_005093 [Coniocarpon cinnabarinum]
MYILAKVGRSPFKKLLNLVIVTNLVYSIGITSIKLSALFFYHRVFTVAGRPFRYALITTGAACIIWFLFTFIISFFACVPGWNVSIIPHGANERNTCVNTYNAYLGVSIVNLLLDIVILVLPHYPLWKLQVSKQKKWGLACIFFFGYSVFVISMLRIIAVSVLGLLYSPDFAWELAMLMVLYNFEIPIGIFTICLPSMVQLYNRGRKSGFSSLFTPKDPSSLAAAAAIRKAEKNSSQKSSSQSSSNSKRPLVRAPPAAHFSEKDSLYDKELPPLPHGGVYQGSPIPSSRRIYQESQETFLITACSSRADFEEDLELGPE